MFHINSSIIKRSVALQTDIRLTVHILTTYKARILIKSQLQNKMMLKTLYGQSSIIFFTFIFIWMNVCFWLFVAFLHAMKLRAVPEGGDRQRAVLEGDALSFAELQTNCVGLHFRPAIDQFSQLQSICYYCKLIGSSV